MKISVNLRTAGVWLACIGMLSPAATFGARPTVASQTRTQVAVKDVSLGSGNNLTGQVVDAQGQRLADVPVIVRNGAEEVARTATNAGGEFTVAGLRGGVYQITTGTTGGVYRLWAASTAPPAATQGLLLVDNQLGVTRGQCAPGNCGDAGGYPVVQGEYGPAMYGGDACGDGGVYDAGACGAGGCGIGGGCGGCGVLGILSNPWFIGAAVAAAIAIPLALDDDDAS